MFWTCDLDEPTKAENEKSELDEPKKKKTKPEA